MLKLRAVSMHSAKSERPAYIYIYTCNICIYQIYMYISDTIHMYSGITSGRVLNAICPIEWGEISTKQSVGKCKQINLESLCIYIRYIYQIYISDLFWNHMW